MKRNRKKQHTKKVISGKQITGINSAGTILFYIFALCLLGFYKNTFLFRLQELSLFVSSSGFLAEHLEKPGGGLLYAGAFLLQFFYYPWLGIALFIVLSGMIQWLVIKVFPLGQHYFLFSLLPPALLLLSITQLDYVIYIMPYKQIVCCWLLGFLFFLLSCKAYRSLRPLWAKVLFIILMPILFFPLLGTYALLFVLWAGIYELVVSGFSRRTAGLLILSLVSVVITPFLYSVVLYPLLAQNSIWLYGWHVLNFRDSIRLWIPFVILLAIPFVFLFFYRKEPTPAYGKQNIFLNILVLAGCITGIILFTYKDRNFHIQLEMEKALMNRDFDRILEVAEESKDKIPTRIIVQYRNIALHRKKLLLDKMFAYAHGSAPYISSVEVNASSICSPAVYYHYGRINFSYRWCMELAVIRGMHAEHLKYMVRAALFNNEPELARKYLSVLKNTLFHKEWAEKYTVFLNNPDLYKQEEEYKEIYALSLYPERIGENSNNVENCIMTFYRNVPSGTKSMLEFSMAAAMTAKDTKSFMKKLGAYVNQHQGKNMPVHIQEALLLFAALEGYEINRDELDSRIVERYQQYLRHAGTLKGKPEEVMARAMEKDFGDTYWYYYFFVKGMKTS